ncbi:MAG: DUF3365 domain-containing protein [Lentisphaeraceae bacterium]|nr:DUF3365 domain-containing protein [Lentisphaeraceae bacterium]
MGIRGKFTVVIILMGLIIGGITYYLLQKSHEKLIEMEAVRIADTVSTQVLADRAIYTKEVLGKLKKDGKGGSRDYHDKVGFIPLPAQFVRSVSKKVNESSGDLYTFSLKSKWNINEDQGLVGGSADWAWSVLESQDEKFSKITTETSSDWTPAYRFEIVNNKKVLRYMRADLASANACVSCHNKYEKMPEIIAMRVKAGVKPQKQWTTNQLMGAIKVDIPVDKVEAVAKATQNKLIVSLGVSMLVGFVVLSLMIFSLIIKPVEKSILEVNEFSAKVDNVVDCSRKMLFCTDEQIESCEKAISLDGDDKQKELTNLGELAEKNAMSAEESASYCTDLDESFKQLNSRLNKIVGKSES